MKLWRRKALSRAKTNFESYLMSLESSVKYFNIFCEKKIHAHDTSKFCLLSDFHTDYTVHKSLSKKGFAGAAQMFGSDIKPTTGK